MEKEPKRGRLVATGSDVIPGTDGRRRTYHTEFDPNALVMSDDLAKAFLSYKGIPAVEAELLRIVTDARPDLIPPKN